MFIGLQKSRVKVTSNGSLSDPTAVRFIGYDLHICKSDCIDPVSRILLSFSYGKHACISARYIIKTFTVGAKFNTTSQWAMI